MHNKLIVVLGALTLLTAACGRDEEPPPPESPPPATTTPQPPPAEPITPPPPVAPTTPPADQPAAPPADQPATPPADQPATPAPQSEAPGTAPTAAAGDAARGESVYKGTCAVCHAPGVAGAPRLGDKADWGPRIAQGVDTLYTHAVNGYQGAKGVMPPKGGNTALPDADVRAAVDYMVAQAQ